MQTTQREERDINLPVMILIVCWRRFQPWHYFKITW